MAPSTDTFARVAIVQRSLRHYRAGFYTSLRAELARAGIELLLFHSTVPAGEDPRDDAIDIPWSRHLPRRRIRLGSQRVLWQPLDPALRDADLVIVEQASNLILNYRLLWRAYRGRGRVAYWGHGRDFTKDGREPTERVKRFTSRRVHWWFAYTELSADIVAELGFARERITVVNNAIDTTQLARDLAAVPAKAVDRLRHEFDLGTGPVGVYLGNLRENKRLDVLLDAAARIHASRPDFRLLIMGSGSNELADEIRAWAAREPWLHYLGPRYGQARAEVLAASDLLLLPGWVGLVVLDSFVAGIPLVTSRDSAHGPEIAYLRDFGNGRYVAHGSDPARYADAVLQLLDDPQLHARLVRGCQADATRYSVEAMAARFAEGIHHALTAPPTRPGHANNQPARSTPPTR